QHWHYFGRNPATSVDLANMELWWLLTGRPEFRDVGSARQFANILAVISGRCGEVQQMKETFRGSGFYPRPGRKGIDDNFNRRIGGAFRSGNQVFPNQVLFPAFGQPYDYRGRGRWLQGTSTTQRELIQRGRHRFPGYRDYFANANPYPLWLLPSWQASNLTDEPWETKLWESLVSSQTKDHIYGAGQTASLHLSLADRAAVGRSNDRILLNALHNFVNSSSAEANSRQFTSLSWGLKGHVRTHYSGVSSDPKFREWEFTETAPGSGLFEFPPSRFAGTDPFRPDVRSLLRIVAHDRNVKRLQRKLSLNGIVDRNPVNGRLRIRPLTPHPANLPAAVISGSSSVLGAGRFNVFQPEQIGTGSVGRQQQEWLARYDRQRMCRDIYVMLYMFGGGRNIDYKSTDNSTSQVYSTAQLRGMAQTAVNWVDQIDPDDSITKFEYDKNLRNGWNLNDDPFDNDGNGPYLLGTPQYNSNYPEDSAARGVVYGVESQKLAFSEAMAILAKKVEDGSGTAVDHDATEYDDRKHRRFTWIELQNTGPIQVRFTDNDQYQIIFRDVSTNPALQRVIERRLTLRDGIVNAPTAGSDFASRFTIGTSGDVDNRKVDGTNMRTGAVLSSFFKVNPKHGDADDPNMGQELKNRTYTKIAPRDLLNFDLLKVNNSRYRINQAPGTSSVGDGKEIQRITGVTPEIPSGVNLLTLKNQDGINARFYVRVILRRRLNANRQPPKRNINGTDANHFRESRDNPWVTVDEILMPVGVFALGDMTKAAALRTQLRNLRSLERRQPLARRPLPIKPSDLFTAADSLPENPALPPSVYRFNSLGGGNRISGPFPTKFTLWQPHFNRPFSSLTDAFNIPTYGPHELTRRLGTGSASNNKINWTNTAGALFLRPDLPTGGVNPGNRWFRVLSLFEVPEPNPDGGNPDGAPGINPWFVTDVGTNNALGYYRTAGRINLNTLRHPSVYAGLLDAPNALQYNRNGPNFLQDRNEANRDWWY
ncbi:MAG: hypothetical protein IID45_10600, partial [Planctomycetes bacterium]|nr:hypothetical protein [Planctomycetota bacterium]